MSYGRVYIETDIKTLKSWGTYTKAQIINILAQKYKKRYPNVSLSKAKRLIKKIYEGKPTTVKDWY